MDEIQEQPAGSQSIDRAFSLLSVVAEYGGAEVAMPVLIRETGLRRPTIRRIMLALMRAGFIGQAPGGGYFLGPECMVVGAIAAHRYNLLEVSLDSLITLAIESGDSSFVSVRRGSYSVCLHREEGSFPIRSHVLQPGARHPLGVGAGAMAILAALSEDEAEEVIAVTRAEIDAEYPRFDETFIRQELAATRERGWSINPGMYVASSWAIGVPIIGLYETVLGAISITAIDSRMTPDRQGILARLLIDEASKIEARLKTLARLKPKHAIV